MSSSHLKVISIDDLRVGMFVVKLDVSWLDSPFLSHTRAIKDASDIKAMRDAGIRSMTIDLERGIDVPSTAQDRTETRLSPPSATPAPLPKPSTPLETPQAPAVSLERELRVAVHLRSKIKKAVENLTRALETGSPVDTAELVPLVDSTLDSLERNDQALMSLVHLSRKAHKLADHVFGAFCLVLNLAVQRKIPEREREQLGLAALLHEAGWTQLPLNLIGKRTRYTPTELALVKKHTLVGNQILSRSELPDLTRRLVAEHHELLDGSGYPAGLRGDQIHPLSQLLTVVDAYEERVHQLSDEPGMIPTNALRSLYKDAEKGVFPPDVVAALINLLGIYPPTAAVLLNTGERAVVKAHHADAPLQPLLVIYYDKSGNALDRPLEVDLRNQTGQQQRAIDSAIDLLSPGAEQWRHLFATEDNLNVG